MTVSKWFMWKRYISNNLCIFTGQRGLDSFNHDFASRILSSFQYNHFVSDLKHGDILFNSKTMLYSCPNCPKTYKGKYTLKRHLKLECGKEPTNRCDICGQMFIHKHRLFSHIRALHLFSSCKPESNWNIQYVYR